MDIVQRTGQAPGEIGKGARGQAAQTLIGSAQRINQPAL